MAKVNKFDELYKRYPKVFPSRISMDAEKGTPMQFWGFECGQGWAHILDAAGLAISVLIKQAEAENKKLKFETLQIKEKFGDLCWYYRCADKRVDGIIFMAEILSKQTCESCGKPASTQSDGGWYSTLCDKCRKKKK